MWKNKWNRSGYRYSQRSDNSLADSVAGIAGLLLLAFLWKLIQLYNTNPTKFVVGTLLILSIISAVYYLYRKNENDKLVEFEKKQYINEIDNISKNNSNQSSNIKNEIRGTICKTLRGEEVKSKFEKEIADFLYRQKIEYTYEKSYTLKNGAIIRPDFYLNDYDVYIEYFGGQGVPSYNQIIALKKDTFKSENMNVIELWPNNYNKLEYIIKSRFEQITKRTFPQRSFIGF